MENNENPSTVAHAFNPRIQKADLWIPGQPGLHAKPKSPHPQKKDYHDIFTHHALQSIKMIMSTVATYKNIDSNKKAKYILSVLYTHI